MSDNKLYLAVGEEANRGTKEATTVGFIPLAEAPKFKFEPDDKRRKEFRGEDSLLDARHRQRRHRDMNEKEKGGAAGGGEHVDVVTDQMLALARGIAAAADRHPATGEHERARQPAHRFGIAGE
mgnify:CR=1 FL=1